MPPFSFSAFASACLDQLRDPYIYGAFCVAMVLIVILLIRQSRASDRRAYIQHEKDAADRLRDVRPAQIHRAIKGDGPGRTA